MISPNHPTRPGNAHGPGQVRTPLRSIVVVLWMALACAVACERQPEKHGHEHGSDAHEDVHDSASGVRGETDSSASADESAHAHEEEDHDPWEVELDATQLRESGIAVVEAGPRELEVVLTATAVVGDNLDAQAHVTPRLPGFVRSIHGHLGDRVRKGDLLCEIDSTELGLAVSQALDADARWKAAQVALSRETELLNTAVEIAESIYEREKGLAEREISTLRPLYDAEKELQQARIARDRRVLQLEMEAQQARIQRDGAMRRLRILGVDPSILDAGDESEAVRSGRYTIEAPLDGVIVERDITSNESVGLEDVLYRIQDLGRVWVLASVFEHDLSRVRLGSVARVRLNAFPDHVIEGRVAFIDYHVDRESRAVSIRIEVENEAVSGWPEEDPIRPGMFGVVDITTATRHAPVVIPEAAVVHVDGESRVFVALSDTRFQGRPVEVSATTGGLVEVKEGIAAGEEVVIEGTFLLKSMAMAEQLGGGHSH